MNKFIIGGGILLLLVIVGVLLYFFVFKKESKKLSGQIDASVNAHLAESYDTTRHGLVSLTVTLKFTNQEDIQILEDPNSNIIIGLKIIIDNNDSDPVDLFTLNPSDNNVLKAVNGDQNSRVIDFTFTLKQMYSFAITKNMSFKFKPYYKINSGEEISITVSPEIILDDTVNTWVDVIDSLGNIENLKNVIKQGLSLVQFSGVVDESSGVTFSDSLDSGQYKIKNIFNDKLVDVTIVVNDDDTINISSINTDYILNNVTFVKEEGEDYFLIKKDNASYVWYDETSGNLTEISNQLLLYKTNAHFILYDLDGTTEIFS